MDTNKVQKLIEKLSSDTIQSKIDWEHAYEYEAIDYNSNTDISNIFLADEFRQIFFEDSYYAFVPSFATIFVILESSESGRDGTRLRGYNVYIQDNTDHVVSPSCPQAPIYQLVNSIKSYLAKKEKPLETLIDSYLSSSDDSNH